MPVPSLLIPLLLVLQDEGATDAAEGAEPGGSNIMFLMVGLVALFYFVMILPEKKNRKQREEMLGGLKKGDEVMTTSGMYGRVAIVEEDKVVLQVADGVRLKFSRAAIQTVEGLDKDKQPAAEPAEAKDAEKVAS